MGSLKAWWRSVRPKVLRSLAYGIGRFMTSTVRVRVENAPDSVENAIVCGWHGRTLMFAHHYRNCGWWVMISHSRDGEIQASVFQRLGFRVIRGSTGRGGVRAAVEAIRVLKNGGTMAITPDGPRGPNHEVQPGIMFIAQKSGARLIPGACSARPRLLMRAWDRHMIPIPFGRALLLYGAPLTVPADATEEEVEVIRRELQQTLRDLHAECERRMGYGEASA